MFSKAKPPQQPYIARSIDELESMLKFDHQPIASNLDGSSPSAIEIVGYVSVVPLFFVGAAVIAAHDVFRWVIKH